MQLSLPVCQRHSHAAQSLPLLSGMGRFTSELRWCWSAHVIRALATALDLSNTFWVLKYWRCRYAAVRAYDLAWPSFHLLRFRCKNIIVVLFVFDDDALQLPVAHQPRLQKSLQRYVIAHMCICDYMRECI